MKCAPYRSKKRAKNNNKKTSAEYKINSRRNGRGKELEEGEINLSGCRLRHRKSYSRWMGKYKKKKKKV